MTSNGATPSDASDEVTRRIVEAAADIFLSCGFDAATTEAIAAAADISHGSLKERFASKEDLFRAAADGLVEQHVLPAGVPAWNGAIPRSDAREFLHAIALAVLQAVSAPDVMVLDRVIFTKAARSLEFARAIHESCNARLLPMAENCLRDGTRRGELDVPDPRFAAEHFLNSVACAPLYRSVLGLDRKLSMRAKRENLRRSLDLFLAGCGSRFA